MPQLDGSSSSPIRRRLLAGLAVAVLLLVVFHLGGGWYFSSTLNDRALSGEARLQALAPEYTVEVLKIGDGTITLRGEDDELAGRDGTFGLAWNGGYGVIGPISAANGIGSVTRAFDVVSGDAPAIGAHVFVDRRVYPGDPLQGLGIAFEDVTYSGELGDYPAWYIPGESSTWFIFVHGNGMTRRDGLRMLPAIVEAGLPVLVPTYRNDEGAPANEANRLTYGMEEWRDLESAVDYAIANGAESVVAPLLVPYVSRLRFVRRTSRSRSGKWDEHRQPCASTMAGSIPQPVAPGHAVSMDEDEPGRTLARHVSPGRVVAEFAGIRDIFEGDAESQVADRPG